MPIRIRIYGEGEAARLGATLIAKGAGPGLKARLHGALERGTAGVETEIRASALRKLPSRNGLAREVASAHIAKFHSLGGGSVSVMIRATHRYSLEGLDAGLNVHPLFGDKKHWYPQTVRPGWFTEPVAGRADNVRNQIEKAVSDYLSSL
jgi:hypothetical protein